MTGVGCGIGEVNSPQHSIKKREKCGLARHPQTRLHSATQ
jgi:hypothetical protein